MIIGKTARHVTFVVQGSGGAPTTGRCRRALFDSAATGSAARFAPVPAWLALTVRDRHMTDRATGALEGGRFGARHSEEQRPTRHGQQWNEEEGTKDD